ncbi:MAG: response regulator [Planctomycetes bacterium]|nr:response regulator [Planctomycetota bacterium]
MRTHSLSSSDRDLGQDDDGLAASARGDPDVAIDAIRIPNVLIIEDNPGDVELTMLAFQTRGLIVDFHVAIDGANALQYLQTLAASPDPRPDLILLDLNLPKITGAAILTYIRGEPELAGIPTVILTSSRAARDYEQCARLGVDAYLIKPMTLQEMLEMMEQIAPILER